MAAPARTAPAVHNVSRSIVRAAVALWSERGYQGASVREIVEAAGVTKGAFYFYFDKKEDVLRIIHDEFADYEIDLVDAAIAAGTTAAHKLTLIIEALAESTQFYHQEIAIYFRDRKYLSEGTYDEVRHKRDHLEQLILGVVVGGMERGEFHPSANPKILTFGIVGMCAWIPEWLDPAGPMTGREIGSMYARLVLDGLVQTTTNQSG